MIVKNNICGVELMRKKIVLYLVLFIIIFIWNLYFVGITNYDEVWAYGFSSNIINGLIPYRDYNMVIGPVYPVFISFFLFLFGNNMVSFVIANTIIYFLIYIFMKKFVSTYASLYVILFTVFLLFPGYNCFCFLLFLMILYIEKNSSNDFLIGILLAFLCFTKINIGIFLLVPSFILFFRKKKFEKFLRRVLSFLCVCLVFVLIMFFNSSLIDFINYTILGLVSFGKNNLHIDYSIIIWFVVMGFLFYCIYKYWNIDKLFLIYSLCFLFISYPLFDFFHVYVSILPALLYVFNKFNLLKDDNKILRLGLVYVVFIFYFSVILFYSGSNQVNYKNNVVLRYKKIDSNLVNILDYVNYRFSDLDDNSKLFIFSTWAYLFKMELDMPINKYDLINNGNIGYNGEDVYIKEIDEYCSVNRCIFLISRDEYDGRKKNCQINKSILKYVIDNYNLRESYVGSSDHFEIYDNSKMCLFKK